MTAGQDRLFATQQDQLTSDDYYTPQHVFDALDIRFDLDVCAPPGGSHTVPADNYLTQLEDGLLAPWHGRVWMNPPYSNVTPWVSKFINHANGICLVPHSKSAWHIVLFESDARICAPRHGYFDFIGGPIFMPIVFAAFGDECIAALERIGKVR